MYSTKSEVSYVVGTGGVGTGILFKMLDNKTMGREESRLAYLTSYRDYCKLHIILHYIAALAPLINTHNISIYAIGKVGEDDAGQQMLNEMSHIGINIEGVKKTSQGRTLFSVCFQYPDSNGGNITTSNSASSELTENEVTDFLHHRNILQGKGMVLAVPEVPLSSRITLLKSGKQKGDYTVASILSSEIEEFSGYGGIEATDLLSVNEDEARAIALLAGKFTENRMIETCIAYLQEKNPKISIIITKGKQGSYTFSNDILEYVPILESKAVSTAGAGDAFLSGTMVGLICGLPLQKKHNDEWFSQTPIASAAELGTILASMAVSSPHSIYPDISMDKLKSYMSDKGMTYANQFKEIFLDDRHA